MALVDDTATRVTRAHATSALALALSTLVALLACADAWSEEKPAPEGRWRLDSKAAVRHLRNAESRTLNTSGRTGFVWDGNAHLVFVSYGDRRELVACELWLRPDGTASLLASFLPARAPGERPFIEGRWRRQGDEIELTPDDPSTQRGLPRRIVVVEDGLRLHVDEGLPQELKILPLRLEPTAGRLPTLLLLTHGEGALLLGSLDVEGLRTSVDVQPGGGGGGGVVAIRRWTVEATYEGDGQALSALPLALRQRFTTAFRRAGIAIDAQEESQTDRTQTDRTQTVWRLSRGDRRAQALLRIEVAAELVWARLEYVETLWRERPAEPLTLVLTWGSALLAFFFYVRFFRRRKATA